jgi:hypothetical protein
MLDDRSLKGPAQRALVRCLRMVVTEDERWRQAVRDALATAGRNALPEQPSEMLAFVRTHLAPRLASEAPPNLVLALLDDLAAELEEPRSGSAGARLRAPTQLPPSTENPVKRPQGSISGPRPIASSEAAPTTPLRFPKLRESVAQLVRTVSTSLRSVGGSLVVPSVMPPSGVAKRKVTILLVSSDRLERASLARALVSAKFDVTALDHASEMQAALEGGSDDAVAIVSMDQEGVVESLRTFANHHPRVPVVGWTYAPREIAQRTLSTAGVRRASVALRGASVAEVVELVRRVLVVDESDEKDAGDRGTGEK